MTFSGQNCDGDVNPASHFTLLMRCASPNAGGDGMPHVLWCAPDVDLPFIILPPPPPNFTLFPLLVLTLRYYCYLCITRVPGIFIIVSFFSSLICQSTINWAIHSPLEMSGVGRSGLGAVAGRLGTLAEVVYQQGLASLS